MINRRRSRGFRMFAVAMLLFGLAGCTCPPCSAPVGDDNRMPDYRLLKVFEVAGRQGVAPDDGKRYFVSGSTALFPLFQGR